MNKLILNITTIFILVLCSCAGESMENDQATTETRKNELTGVPVELEKATINLNSEQREAFQLRAIQKFQDFMDYKRIISDLKVDSNLRNHSIQLVSELFINDSIPKSHKYKRNMAIQSIRFITPLTSDSNKSYTGVMEAVFLIYRKKTIKKIDVHLIQVEKTFGEKVENITEVRLGNIY